MEDIISKLDYKNPYATICSDWLIKDIDSSTNDINLEYGIRVLSLAH
ncbi:MAG: hypothetical protein IPJ43_11180 [Saprospiraceae bacterium]|nr:hypothetical protein [Saprospiraceae bacterium]